MSFDEKRRGVLVGASGYGVCLLGFVLTLVAFAPGLMSADSIDQWQQGRAWSFYDVHPPLMSALWGVLDRVWPGPLLMLVFHNLLFWGGAALFWKLTWKKSLVPSFVFAAFGFMPQVWAILPTIWKDVGLGGSLLLACALLCYAAAKRSRAAFVAACPLLFYGYGVRLNAAPAVLPVAVWSGFIACRVFASLGARAASRRVVPVACGLVYFIVLTVAVTLTNKALSSATLHPYQQILLHDLAAISKETGRDEFPEYISRGAGFSKEKAAEAYQPVSVNTLIYGTEPPLKITPDAGHVGELRARWREAVAEHPSLYLRHRWALYSYLTGFNTEDVVQSFYPATGMNNPRPIRSPMNALTRALTSYFFFFSNSPLFRGFFWILLAAGLVYMTLRRRLEGELEAAFVISLSGLLYALGYFFYAPSSEFRYLWWTVLAVCVAAALFAAYAKENRRPNRGKIREEERPSRT